MLLLKSAPVKKRGRASTQLQNWENVIFGALGNLTPCPKHLDVPVSSRVCCMAGWSGSTEMCCQGYGSTTWGGRRCLQRVCEQLFGIKPKNSSGQAAGAGGSSPGAAELWLEKLTRQEKWGLGLWFSMLCTFGTCKNNLCFASGQERGKMLPYEIRIQRASEETELWKAGGAQRAVVWWVLDGDGEKKTHGKLFQVKMLSSPAAAAPSESLAVLKKPK